VLSSRVVAHRLGMCSHWLQGPWRNAFMDLRLQLRLFPPHRADALNRGARQLERCVVELVTQREPTPWRDRWWRTAPWQ